jgi:hypothetical protein
MIAELSPEKRERPRTELSPRAPRTKKFIHA